MPIGFPAIIKTAQIEDGAVTTDKVADSSISGDKINSSPASRSSQVIASDASWTPASGLWLFAHDNTYLALQLYIASAWKPSASTGEVIVGLALCDGANVRVYNKDNSNSHTIYYNKF